MKSRTWKLVVAIVIATLLAPLAGCATPAPEVVEKVVTQVIKETVIVEGTPQVVEKEVTKVIEKEVTKVVEVEVPVEPEAEPKVLTMMFTQEPDSLNAIYYGMWYAALVADLFNPGLWTWNDVLEPSLEMAAEFPTKENGLISEDGMTVTIPINPDAKWSDGEPVTAEDFVFTYEMIMDPANIAVNSTWPYADYVETITAEDNSLVIQFSDTFAAWATTMFGFVLPKHILQPVYDSEGTIDDAEWNRDPTVVNGAFKLKEWEAGGYLALEANDSYWRGRPNLDQINILIVPDSEAQMNGIKAGDTDVGIFLSYSEIPTLQALEHYVDMQMVLSGYNESWFFNLNTDETAAKNGHPALQDVRVRQAIAYAVDFDAICEELLYGETYPPPTKWEETPYAYPDANPYKYDPEKAEALLDEAGWVDSNGDGTRDKDGVELVLIYATTQGREIREQTQVVAMQMLAEVGIGIEVQNGSYDVFWNSYGEGGPIATGQFDIGEWSDSFSFPDPTESQWLCSEIPSDESPDGSNWYGICDEELDALFRAQEVEMDPVKRIELFHEVSKIINEKAYWLGVWHDNDLWTTSKRAKNVRFSGADPFWNCFEWDVED
jgi:peptide/nickel transport system substrate-binding protein